MKGYDQEDVNLRCVQCGAPGWAPHFATCPYIQRKEEQAREEELQKLQKLLAAQQDPLLKLPDPKPTNPKDMIGANKVPLHLWPETATVLGSMAMLYGALQYGRSNFRGVGVRASIYYDAARRHLNGWFEGEDLDPDSNLPHLAHALACIAIIIDAQAAGKLNDDRMVRGGYRKLIDSMTPHVARLKTLFAAKAPKHYTIEDNLPVSLNASYGAGLVEDEHRG